MDLFRLLMLCLLVTVAGCGESGPKVVPVAGKVLIDGEPLDYGYIRFVPKQGRASSAELESDGSFELRYSPDKMGAVLGSHRVEVAANETLGPTKVVWHAPKKYASIGTSGLSQDIAGPQEDLVIELDWGGQEGPLEEVFKGSSSF